MGYLNSILMSNGDLDASERQALLDWKAVMEADCAAFGETSADTERMRRIDKRLAEDSANG